MSDAVGPVFIDQKLSGDFQKSIDAEVTNFTRVILFGTLLTSSDCTSLELTVEQIGTFEMVQM